MKFLNKYIIIIVSLLLCDVVGVMVVIRYRHYIAKMIDSVYNDNNMIVRNSHPERIAELGVLKDEPNEWYCKYEVIAHGGGGIDGKTCTNSHEAICIHYSNGTRLFDIDMNFTSDSVLVCRHGWNDNLEQNDKYRAAETRSFQWDIEQLRYNLPQEEWKQLDFENFSNTRPYKKYTPISVVNFIDFMKERNDIWVLCDFGYMASKKYRYFYNNIESKLPDSISSRIVVTFNSYEDLKYLREINPKVKVQLKRYGMITENYYNVAKFCIDNEVHAINISTCNIDDSYIRLLKEHGIHIYVAAIDYLSDYRYCISQGASGIVSNFLFENDLKLK